MQKCSPFFQCLNILHAIWYYNEICKYIQFLEHKVDSHLLDTSYLVLILKHSGYIVTFAALQHKVFIIYEVVARKAVHPVLMCSHIQRDSVVFQTLQISPSSVILNLPRFSRRQWTCFMHRESPHDCSCTKVLFNFHFFLIPIFSNITGLHCIPSPWAILATVWQTVLNKKAKIRFLHPHECSLY